MLHKAWNSKGEMPYCFPRSSIKFQDHTVENITDFDPNWAFPDYRPVAAFKSLRFALLIKMQTIYSPQNGENASENIVCEKAVILSKRRWVKWLSSFYISQQTTRHFYFIPYLTFFGEVSEYSEKIDHFIMGLLRVPPPAVNSLSLIYQLTVCYVLVCFIMLNTCPSDCFVWKMSCFSQSTYKVWVCLTCS